MAKILVVGDDLVSTGNVEATIAAEGYEVISGMTGLDAVEMTLEQTPDMVIMDESLAVFNGFEACQMLRDDPEVPNELPIVLLSSGDIDVRKLEAVGATDYMLKTLENTGVRDMVINLLGDKAGN